MPGQGPARALLWLVVCGTAIRLLLGGAIGLGVDESYMIAAGRTFHLGYFDHPPLAWWLSAAAGRLAGSEAALVVRLPFIALFALSTVLMYRLTARLFSAEAGFLAALALNLSPVFGITSGSWVLPDGPLDAALLGFALCLVNALESGAWRWWMGAGVAAGLAMSSKYTAGLVLAGAFIGIATQPAQRHWLARPEPYAAALVALVLFSPQLIWNAQHDWASFAFQGGRATAARWQPFGPFVTTAGQALFLLPWVWFGLMVVFIRGLRAGPAMPAGWLLCWMAAIPILLFPLVALWSRNVLFHWAAPGYLFAFPLLGGWAVSWRPAVIRRWALGTGGFLAVVLLVAVTEVRFNWLAGISPGLDPGLQARDWTGLRDALAQRGLLHGAIAAPSWSDTGKVSYGLGMPVLCLNLDAREFAFAPGPAAHLGEDVLIVGPRQTEARIVASYGAMFESIEVLAPATLALPGRRPVDVPLFLGHRLKHWP